MSRTGRSCRLARWPIATTYFLAVTALFALLLGVTVGA